MNLLDRIVKERQALDRSIYLLDQSERSNAPEAVVTANRLAIKDHQDKLARLVAQLNYVKS